ncbi:putative DNA-binding transcriptional regulator YafY [Metabacillus crassostreae]|uniref:hypothetical protein n=1 Tax=Metabacillus crassostreae TaxID=929098 RepID=UPI0019598D8A|nr:hypothetical protein [Metabacillus crassostreae]MBM7605970.1 putative DNA-binding transcriptional regulator YafY [Metabacillus crassostreae]
MNSMLLRSQEQNKPIEIIYINENGNISQRIIRVIEMNDSIIKAYCYLRNAKRVFKKENLLSAAVVKPRLKGAC